MNTKILGGVVHTLPIGLRKALTADAKTISKWNDLTPLARNEWICWVTFVKQEKTRANHIKRTLRELKQGKSRPCCWIGCIHRKDKELSPSIKALISKTARH